MILPLAVVALCAVLMCFGALWNNYRLMKIHSSLLDIYDRLHGTTARLNEFIGSDPDIAEKFSEFWFEELEQTR